MPIKWIISDIDGCLSHEGSEPFDIEKFSELARLSRDASENRISLAPITLCTGRPQPYVELMMKLLHVGAPAICESGAVLYDLRDNHGWFGPGVTEEKVEGLRSLRKAINSEILPRHEHVYFQLGKESHVSYYAEETERLDRFRGEVEELTKGDQFPEVKLSYSVHYLNISLKGVDKGSSINELIRHLGVSREETAGIGDTEGDMPLREAVGFFACPANAEEKLKEAADYVSPFNQLEGVLDILRRPEMQRQRV